MEEQEAQRKQAQERYRALRFRPGDYIAVGNADHERPGKDTVGVVQALVSVSAQPCIVVTEGGDVRYLDDADLSSAHADAQARCAEIERQLRASRWSAEEERTLLERFYGHDNAL